MVSQELDVIEKPNWVEEKVNINWNYSTMVTDMTPTAANAWVKTEEAKRDTIILPAKYKHLTSFLTNILVVVTLIIVACLACFSNIPDGRIGVLIAVVVTLGGAWGVKEVVRELKGTKNAVSQP